jgi:hypothetical protein
VHRILVRFHGDLRQVLLGGAVLLHALPRQHRPECGARHADAALAQVLGVVDVLDTGGLDEALRHLLAAHHEDDVVQPAGHQRMADVECVAARCAARREVVHGNTRSPHLLSTTSLPFSPQPLPPEKRELAADTASISRQSTPASARAASTASRHILVTDLSGNFPQGCIPNPRTATSLIERTLRTRPASAGLRPAETSR